MCCSKCFQKICMQSISAGKLWLHLCEIQATTFMNPVSGEKGSKELAILEKMGFITTTDVNDHIVVKVHGMQQDEEGIYFCIGNCNDQEDVHKMQS